MAVLASLFSRYGAGPVVGVGEDEADGRRGLVRMVEESAITAITLQMLEPKARALRWWKLQ